MNKYNTHTQFLDIWISKIPAHWQAHKMKHLFSERSEKGYPNEPLLVASQNMGVVPKNVYGNRTVEAQKDLHLLKLVRVGDFVISLRSFQGGLEYAYYQGIISPAYTILIPHEPMSGSYFRYLAKSKPFIGLLTLCVTGIREGQNIDYAKLKNHLLPVPPHEEQDQIVRFLNWKVSSINKLIRIRKRQIEELEAIKRSSIGYLVMGQAQSIPQRDTEVNWVKTIPAHWNEKTLIQVAEEQQIKNAGMVEDNLLSLSYGKIINKDINTADGLLPSSFEGYQIVHDGNIILRLTDLQNDHKSLRTGLVTQTGIITSAYTCLKVRHNILPEYLQLQLHVADLCKVFYGMGGGVRQSIGFTEIRKLVIAIPPVEEQQYILDRVHGIEKPINCAIQNIRDIIAGLEDLKTRLISDAVTGKIDVRGIEIPEYEFVDEDNDNVDENLEQGADEPPEEE